MEAFVTTALGLKAPWEAGHFDLNVATRRINFEAGCKADSLDGAVCGARAQGIHKRVQRRWRHLDFRSMKRGRMPRCRVCNRPSAPRPMDIPQGHRQPAHVLLAYLPANPLHTTAARAQTAKCYRDGRQVSPNMS